MDDFQEDNIRIPDEIICDQLLEDTRSQFEKQIDEAIQLSIKDINEQQINNMKYEEEILKEYNDETNRRQKLFKDFLCSLVKLTKFDKEINDIYNILEPIIESYCNQCIKTCDLDKATYDKIFSLLKKIRIDKTALETLNTIVLREE